MLYHVSRSKEAIRQARDLREDGKHVVLWRYSDEKEYLVLKEQLKATDTLVMLEEE
jgi:ATP phosphoribosyltransferase regulatory subunit